MTTFWSILQHGLHHWSLTDILRNQRNSSFFFFSSESPELLRKAKRLCSLILRLCCSDLPENAALLNNMGSALLTLGKVEEGASMLRQSIEIDPTQHDVLVNLGTHLQEEGDLDGAKVLYTK